MCWRDGIVLSGDVLASGIILASIDFWHVLTCWRMLAFELGVSPCWHVGVIGRVVVC